MIILSIDVGIKNLSYCLMKKHNNNTIEIIQWGILDLSLTQSPTLTNTSNTLCSTIVKGKSKKDNSHKCTKVAKFMKHGMCFCAVHAKQQPYISYNKNLNIDKLTKYSKSQLQSIIDNVLHNDGSVTMTPTKSIPTIKIMIEYIQQVVNTQYFELVSCPTKPVSDKNLVNIGRNIHTQLDDILGNIALDAVIIENQIGPKAIKMKTIQGMLAQYCIMRNPTTNTIEFVSSIHKLKEYTELNTKLTYPQRKKLAISTCLDILNSSTLLRNGEEWMSLFTQSKKKDDLGDCFLQGKWYLMNKC